MAGDTIGEAWVAIRPDTSQFGNLLSSGISGPLADVNKGALIVIGSLVALGGIALDLNSKYQSALLQIEGRMNITAKAGNAIGSAFLSTAGKATFSAVAIAQAFAPVAGQLDTVNKGALSASQSLTFMDTAMGLAEATSTPLASATADLASIIQTFGLNLKDAADASNILYNTSNALGVPVDSLTTSLERARSSAGAAAPSLSDLSTFLLDLTEHGETGRQAMTLLGTALTGIETPTAKVLAYQKELNLSFIQSNGQLKPLSSIIGELSPIIGGMGNAQATATLKALGFGSASGKIVDTIKAGLPSWEEANKKINTQAGVAQAADKNTSGLAGAWDTFSSNVTDMLTKAGSPLNTFLENAVKWLNKNLNPAVDWAIKYWPVWGRILGGIVASWVIWNAVALAGRIVGMITAIITAVPGIAAFAAASWAAAAPWLAMAAALAAVAGYIAIMIGGGSGAQAADKLRDAIAAGRTNATGPTATSSGVTGLLPGRAAGGPVIAGHGYMVGEMGPEFFQPSQNGMIIPHGAAGGITQYNSFSGLTSENVGMIEAIVQRNNRKLVVALQSK
jgi:TP901 family phage tail tape measure protein